MRGRGLISRAIRWQTRCQFSHCALYVGGGYLLEAWPPAVRLHYCDDWSDMVAYTHPEMRLADWQQAEKLIRSQIGRPYDYGAVVRFATGWQKDQDAENGKWFCFEILHWALRRAGFPLAKVSDSRIHGGHFEASPAIVRTILP